MDEESHAGCPAGGFNERRSMGSDYGFPVTLGNNLADIPAAGRGG